MQEPFFYQTNRMTAPMEYYLQSCDTFEAFEEKYLGQFLTEDRRVGTYLEELLLKYGKTRFSAVSEAAGLHASYLGNIVNGKSNNPGRDALLSICLAIGTTVEEAQYLLKYAGQAPLYVRRKRDIIIWFALMKHLSLAALNDTLCNHGYATMNEK